MIRSFSALQPICAGLGVLLVILGRRAKRTADDLTPELIP